MERARAPFTIVDWLLLAAIAVLSATVIAMSYEPVSDWWRNRPTAGAQVCLHYVGEHRIDYLLYLPQEYDSSRKWPLVVFLHGAGGDGGNLDWVRKGGPAREIDRGKKFPFILVSPHWASRSPWAPEAVVEFIEYVSKTFPVDRDRVYLTGFSMGGFGTWSTACYDPGRFAAAVPVSGGGDVQQAGRVKNLPIWAFHGAKDDVVPAKASQEMVDAIKKCGGDVQLTLYSNRGHGIPGYVYADARLYKWLLAQRRGKRSNGATGENHASQALVPPAKELLESDAQAVGVRKQGDRNR